MKLYIVYIFVSIVVSGFAWDIDDLETRSSFQTALRSRLIKCNHDRNLNLDVSEIKVHFDSFTTLTIAEAAHWILSWERLIKTKKFIFFVDTFKSKNETTELIEDTFSTDSDSYLIIIDHSAYTNGTGGTVESYERSVRYVHYIAQALGSLLTELRNGGVSPKNMHGIGNSLGSHILGQAGEAFFNNTGEKIWRITGLDPAGPCFTDNQDHLRSGDAEFVEVYHCNAGGLGTKRLLADIDFYVNEEGKPQDNCTSTGSKESLCNPTVCLNTWTNTVFSQFIFVAWKCDSHKPHMGVYKKCSLDETTPFGFLNSGEETGTYCYSSGGCNYFVDKEVR